ncbi:MAG: hypothetical protein AAFU49_09655, partial [Pseudomonadota bacterium]
LAPLPVARGIIGQDNRLYIGAERQATGLGFYLFPFRWRKTQRERRKTPGLMFALSHGRGPRRWRRRKACSWSWRAAFQSASSSKSAFELSSSGRAKKINNLKPSPQTELECGLSPGYHGIKFGCLLNWGRKSF